MVKRQGAKASWVGLWMACHVMWVAGGCTQTQTIPDEKPDGLAPKPDLPDEPAFSDISDPSADAPQDAQHQALSSTIKEVTVYSDRALVTRLASAEVTTEPTIFAFRKLPGWVDDGSVRVSVSAGRIVDVRAQRDYLARSTDEDYKAAEDAQKALANQMAALNDELRILDAEKAQIESIKAFSLEKVTKDMTMGPISVDTYGQVVRFISDSLRSTAEARRNVIIKRDALAPEIQAANLRLGEMRNLTQLEETTVLVTLQSSQDTTSDIKLTYLLPGATWEPMHELRTKASDPNSVEVASFAVVTQTSGEDWSNALLTFSTQSSTQSIHIPELEALTLGDTHTATRLMSKQASSFTRAQEAFKSQNYLWNKMNQKSFSARKFEQVYQDNLQYLEIVQSKTVQIFQSLQSRGTTAHFKSEDTATVRGDGRSVRLRIGRSTLKASQKIVAAPEQSLNATRTLQLTNSSKLPFLPGKVALYRDGAFLGMTELEFIAAGESFALFLNVEDQLKLNRVLDKKLSSIVRKKRTRMTIAFIVTVENLSAQETTLDLADRIPVSQNKEIKIDNVRINPEVKPDSQGILQWSLSLKPKETRRFKISYQIEYPPTLVLETKRKQMSRPKPAPDSPNEPAQRYKYELEDQILDLEDNF